MFYVLQFDTPAERIRAVFNNAEDRDQLMRRVKNAANSDMMVDITAPLLCIMCDDFGAQFVDGLMRNLYQTRSLTFQTWDVGEDDRSYYTYANRYPNPENA